MLQTRMASVNFDALLIAGPTASGKSAVALSLAERFNGVVVNADSMQVYAEIPILSARPKPEDEARAPHRLYGHVQVTERYSAGRYQREVAPILQDCRASGRLAIITGGTGLYFSALEEGLSPIPPIPADIKRAVTERFDEIGANAFFAEFAQEDPRTASQLRSKDRQRILRAAEVFRATGLSLAAWQEKSGASVLADLRVARFVVSPPRAVLHQRIGARFGAMMKAGALDEARALLGLDPLLPAAKALGVPQLQKHLAGLSDLSTAVEEAEAATRQYAKRQMTWARTRMRTWNWVEDEELRNIIACIIISMN